MNYTARATLQDAATAAGNGSIFVVEDLATVVLQVSGTFSATVSFEGTVDGTNWVAVRAQNLATGVAATSTTSAGLFRLTVAGLAKIRAPISSYTSGSITVKAFGTSMGAGAA